MTNFSGNRTKGLWSWLTPERAVVVMPVLAGLALSIGLLSVGVAPLTMRVREQKKMVNKLSSKAEFVPILQQQLADLKSEQEQREEQLDRLLDLVAGTAELQTLLAGLNDMGRFHNVAITTTQPGEVERFQQPLSLQSRGQVAPPAAGGGDSRKIASDPLLNRSLEKNTVSLTVTGSFQKVLAFLQSLESLQTFVLVSEMNIGRQRKNTPNGLDRFEVAMDVKLTAYGRQQESLAQPNKSPS